MLTAPLLPAEHPQLKVIRQLLTAAFIDQVAIRKDLVAPSEGDSSKYASTRGVAYRAIGVDEDVFIHPSSILFHSSPPECVVYQELVRTSRVFIRGESHRQRGLQHASLRMPLHLPYLR